MRYRLRTLVFVMPVIVAIVLSPFVRQAHRSHSFQRVQQGMTREKVLEICGPPQEIMEGDHWSYDLWWAGWASFYFDDKDEVCSIDIESPFDGL